MRPRKVVARRRSDLERRVGGIALARVVQMSVARGAAIGTPRRVLASPCGWLRSVPRAGRAHPFDMGERRPVVGVSAAVSCGLCPANTY